MEEEGEAVRRPLNLRGRFMSQDHEPYVRFSVKFPHFRSRPADLPPAPTNTSVIRHMFGHPAPAASVEPLTSSANAQGVVQSSNRVTVLNLGGIPNLAAANSSASSSSCNNY